jgi:5-methyltetrahydrofolate--homocysteine methyltransferase
MDTLKEIARHLEKGDSDEVARLTRRAIDDSLDAKTILDDGLIAGMNVVGQKFKAHEIFLPDVLMAARAMYAGLNLLKPLLQKENVPMIGKAVIGTVRGDMHDIGKNLVGIMLRGAGFDVVDLGKDVSPERFVTAAIEEGADIIGLSALLTTTMPAMKEVIEAAKNRGIYGKVKILIGGAPVSDEYAREIGADAYCFDGINAVERARKFLGIG